eukprot:GFUD01023362.1.p1 GENE.GFUD01023362.1~~GFUD01023362.1.p1  ORF type:complete len:173 (-),score=51.10 GFUD01023362.1:61-579(-)
MPPRNDIVDEVTGHGEETAGGKRELAENEDSIRKESGEKSSMADKENCVGGGTEHEDGQVTKPEPGKEPGDKKPLAEDITDKIPVREMDDEDSAEESDGLSAMEAVQDPIALQPNRLMAKGMMDRCSDAFFEDVSEEELAGKDRIGKCLLCGDGALLSLGNFYLHIKDIHEQ